MRNWLLARIEETSSKWMSNIRMASCQEDANLHEVHRDGEVSPMSKNGRIEFFFKTK
jgi:hypothetical protein